MPLVGFTSGCCHKICALKHACNKHSKKLASCFKMQYMSAEQLDRVLVAEIKESKHCAMGSRVQHLVLVKKSTSTEIKVQVSRTLAELSGVDSCFRAHKRLQTIEYHAWIIKL